MSERLLQLDDVRNTNSPEKIASLFQKLGYNVVLTAQPIAVEDLQLPARSAEATSEAFLHDLESYEQRKFNAGDRRL